MFTRINTSWELFFSCLKILSFYNRIMYQDTHKFVLHITGDDRQLVSQEITVSKKRKGMVILAYAMYHFNLSRQTYDQVATISLRIHARSER